MNFVSGNALVTADASHILVQNPKQKNYTTVGPKQFALFKPKLELATPRAGRQRIAYRAGGHILRKN